jgi:hypothetical protein
VTRDTNERRDREIVERFREATRGRAEYIWIGGEVTIDLATLPKGTRTIRSVPVTPDRESIDNFQSGLDAAATANLWRRLADALGTDANAALDRLSPAEITQWAAYFSVRPVQKRSSSIWSACIRIIRRCRSFLSAS